LFVFASAIAGARVESVTEGLGKAFGVKEGVLVIQAPPGSPAYVSGLRDGDVIITAAGTAIANLRQLGGVLSDLDRENGVKLVIVRDKKQQDVMLRFR
jgi:serine protease Do